ncbi:hypothetical protein [Chlorogloeopsis fritschii]|nr:hypothetical protein [Chlorogloeopsis fritschii]
MNFSISTSQQHRKRGDRVFCGMRSLNPQYSKIWLNLLTSALND